jgi:[acyl-carrier-protein] S-malonyltransferase
MAQRLTLAVLCSGQGLQHSRMFELTATAPHAAEVFIHAAKLLQGSDPRQLIQQAEAGVLQRNRVAQILCACQAMAAAAALREAWPSRLILAGYSVGEVAAWGVAGLMSAAGTLDLVARRAEIMDSASAPGDGLVSVRGLRRTVIDALCLRHAVAIAIVNPSRTYVLGGAGGALDALAAEAKDLGASRVTRVAVSVAAHTPRLAAASTAFGRVLRDAPIKDVSHTSARIFCGIDGTAVRNTQVGKDKLASQISHTVEWADCLQGCVEAGANAFLELGPGSALSTMVERTYPGIPSRSCENFASVDGIRSWLARLDTAPMTTGEIDDNK